MVGYSEKYHSIGSHRVDRIFRNPEILPDDAVPMDTDFDINRYVNTMFRMYDAPRAEVTLLVENHLMDAMIDKFGTDVETEECGEEQFKLRATVSVGTPFFNWVFGFGGMVKIEGPREVKEEYEKRLENARI